MGFSIDMLSIRSERTLSLLLIPPMNTLRRMGGGVSSTIYKWYPQHICRDAIQLLHVTRLDMKICHQVYLEYNWRKYLTVAVCTNLYIYKWIISTLWKWRLNGIYFYTQLSIAWLHRAVAASFFSVILGFGFIVNEPKSSRLRCVGGTVVPTYMIIILYHVQPPRAILILDFTVWQGGVSPRPHACGPKIPRSSPKIRSLTAADFLKGSTDSWPGKNIPELPLYITVIHLLYGSGWTHYCFLLSSQISIQNPLYCKSQEALMIAESAFHLLPLERHLTMSCCCCHGFIIQVFS